MLVKLGQRGQITIPKQMRQQLGLKPGDSVALILRDDAITLQPVTETIFDFVGAIPLQPDGPYSLETLREKASDYIVDRVLDTEDD